MNRRDRILMGLAVAGMTIVVVSPFVFLSGMLYRDLGEVCTEAAREPPPVTAAGRQAAYRVFFACRFGNGGDLWARRDAGSGLAEWRRAESRTPPPEQAAADALESMLYGER